MLYQLVFQAAYITTTHGVPAIFQGKLVDCQCLRIPTANKTLCGGNTGSLFSRPPYFLGVAGSAFFHKLPEAEPNLKTELEVQANMLTSSSRNNIQPDLAVLREEQAGTQLPNRNIMPKENYASDIAFQERESSKRAPNLGDAVLRNHTGLLQKWLLLSRLKRTRDLASK